LRPYLQYWRCENPRGRLQLILFLYFNDHFFGLFDLFDRFDLFVILVFLVWIRLRRFPPLEGFNGSTHRACNLLPFCTLLSAKVLVGFKGSFSVIPDL
jgi:hypothetical protein